MKGVSEERGDTHRLRRDSSRRVKHSIRNDLARGQGGSERTRHAFLRTFFGSSLHPMHYHDEGDGKFFSGVPATTQ